jgi:hypothetical protein
MRRQGLVLSTHHRIPFTQYVRITKTTKVAASYVLNDEALQSVTEDPEVRGYYRSPLNL